jgi:hypothetical protein
MNRTISAAVVQAVAALAVLGLPASAQEEPSRATAPDVVRRYYDALLVADTATAEALSNGMLPIDFSKVEGVRVGTAQPRDSCAALPSIPASGPAAAPDPEVRRIRDSVSGVLDSLFAGMEGAEACATVPTELVVVPREDGPDVVVSFPTHVRRLEDGWRVDAFTTGTKAAPAVLETISGLLRDLGDALEQHGGAAADSGG